MLIAAVALSCGAGCGSCEGDSAERAPDLPPLPDERPAHGIDEIVLSSHRSGADEGWSRQLRIRRDGCYRTRTVSSSGSETTTTRCALCSTAAQVAPLFRSVAARLSAMSRWKMGKSGTPPISLDDHWTGRLRVRTSDGEQRVAGAGIAELESVARRLHDKGVPGAPDATDEDCVATTGGARP